MDTIPKQEPVIQSLVTEWYQPYVAAVDMLRLDVVHPVVSGNKWYKLKYNIQHALKHSYSSVLTFGGAYSNHLIATAAAAEQYDLRSIGIVKGVYAKDALTETLQQCVDHSMQLVFIANEDYARKEDANYLEILNGTYNRPFIIPEGGANEWGRAGCAEMAAYIDDFYTHVCVSVGTGTSFIGIRNALPAAVNMVGYVPMKGGSYLNETIKQYLYSEHSAHWQLFDDWHNGGFGKWNDALIDFMNAFYTQHSIPLDIVYTGKMMMGVQEQLQQRYFPEDARILCIHTGGLQGNASVQQRLIY